MIMERIRKIKLPVIIVILSSFLGCKEVAVPKPKGYFRIDLPRKEYISFNEVSSIPSLPLV